MAGVSAARRPRDAASPVGPGSLVDPTILQCAALLFSRSLSIESLSAKLGLSWRSTYRYLSILRRFGCSLDLDASKRYRLTGPLTPNRKLDPAKRRRLARRNPGRWTGTPSELLLQCAALLSVQRLTLRQLEARLGRSPRSVQRYLTTLQDFGARLETDSKGRLFLAAPLKPRRN